jgi:thiosulfate/3-mercaptopyruvate sulfurtransferase
LTLLLLPLVFLPIVRAPACTEIDNIVTVKKPCSRMSLVISAEQLRRMLGSKKILIVDARPFSSYSESHIPGAVNIDLMQFHWIDTSREGLAQFTRQMKILLSNIGISADKFVVFYDDVSGSSAARGVWLLQYFSHEKVAMLDGGMNLWKAMNLKTETKTNLFVHAEFKGRPNSKLIANRTLLSARKGGKRKVIIDARSPEEFAGTVVRAAKSGHIPGATNIDWNGNLKQDSFRPLEELENLYRDIPKDAEVVTYCQGGYRAANTFVVLKMLGFKNVRMYLGSWGEWGNLPDAQASR